MAVDVIVQNVAGEPYGAFDRGGVIARAGLADTAVDDAADVVCHCASGYAWRQSEQARCDNAPLFFWTICGGAGSIRSISEDLCCGLEALLGWREVSAASLREMITPNRLKDGALPLKAVRPGNKRPSVPVKYGSA